MLVTAKSNLGSVEVDVPFPTLVGTEKQVAWAEDIRAKMMEQTIAVMVATKSSADFMRAHPEKAKVALDAFSKAACQQTEAAWWIENRNDPSAIRKLAKPLLAGAA